MQAKVWLAVMVSGLLLGLAGPALGAPATAPAAAPAPQIVRVKRKAWSAAELGFGGSVVADGVTFLGPVITLQGGHYRPLVGVFQLGAGVALYKKPIPDPVYAPLDPEADPTENAAMFYIGLGARVRIFQFLAALRNKPFDLYVGPLVMVFGNHDLVTFGAGGELGFALHFGRVRLSLSVHGGYSKVLHQYANVDTHEFKAAYVVGGQLAAGMQF